ncbi:leucyl/phenylalanyl-tRNA--protein transferase [Clostridium saccharoperbutylacetonicum]|uniref:Leucyl/phenylalanyl-tRNA--protein transferase n=1 Tax=Clostridium saccharoperbutylacetonicum N1-4(HMT) TaxID=931276 RepID=M1MQG9_9CLOT|nr:leucyl/phenylalanyl-tRNA--protein transferase [Clostridium saccharoperbutylacetonicum]AGF56991.1 leucyl/phenylalanyl-tRNA--protein transferase Aat [Clostridium saccharoperbutylacetonicum N1-4(HMT)]NRT62250.1 leucyl/phenylalanyl-tRNA--protein transferase [Clostridium saccharoperbutylacetonicum]NSB25586.1 leucyl/phenylalanyl-tRNA--protein transferase [Clostridium saccharoperbutylacetonicum]NSB44953.1 leucyl/phenylalanyl-tRNA--protein transferase [Clostridium saccharoperbutylacetonicum]
MPVYRLPKEIIFPNPELSEEDGLLAIGGDLSLDRLLLAYCNGIFPWYNEGEPILWWCPKPRFILIPKEINISKSMKKIIKRDIFKVTFNADFEGVINNCKHIREDNNEETWISDDMKAAYINLFNNGYAMSVETYLDEELVGGLYGVKIGKCFFGESMFSKVSNSSKIALIKLAEKLYNEDYLFIDCQMQTKHLESMGGKFVDWNTFKNLLSNGLEEIYLDKK